MNKIFNKAIFKNQIFWLIVLVALTGIILASKFAGGVLCDVKYEYSYRTYSALKRGIVEFHENGIVEMYDEDEPYTNRMFYNYATDGDYVYIYKADSDTYSYKIEIKNRFTLIERGSEKDTKMEALGAKIAFYTILSFNLIFATATVVQITREVIKVKKSQNKVENDQQ